MGIAVLVTETAPTDLLDKLCNEYNIRMALHNHPHSWPPDDLMKAVKDHSKLVGSCSDLGHWMRRGWIPLNQLQFLNGRVEHLHFKDLNEYAENALDVPWGTGKNDPKACLAELIHQGYKGYVSIEYEHGDIAALHSAVPKCVEFFDKTMTELGANPPAVR